MVRFVVNFENELSNRFGTLIWKKGLKFYFYDGNGCAINDDGSEGACFKGNFNI